MTVPDLVVEVISPSDRAGEVQETVRDWLRTGVRLLWYVNPETGTTTVYRGSYAGYVDATETLTGDEVVPGFTVRMLDVMNMLEARQAKSK